jgi:hypothetical protein
MSGMMSWFGGGAAQKRKNTPKEAIVGLRQQLEMLQKRERHLESQISEQDALARKNVATNKAGRLRNSLFFFFFFFHKVEDREHWVWRA